MQNRDLPDLANVSHQPPFSWGFVTPAATPFTVNHIYGPTNPPYLGQASIGAPGGGSPTSSASRVMRRGPTMR
jgi:hypothetical protein